MKLLFYMPGTVGAQKWCFEMAKVFSKKADTEIFRNIEDFSNRLRQPGNCIPSIAVLAVSNEYELLNLVSIGDLLSDTRTIIILPDRKKDTIRIGYTLRPRFMTFTDSNLIEIEAVLEKMIENINKEKILAREDF